MVKTPVVTVVTNGQYMKGQVAVMGRQSGKKGSHQGT